MDLYCPKSLAYLLYTLRIKLYYVHLSGRIRVVWNNVFSTFHSRSVGQSINYILFWSMTNENRIIRGAKVSVQFSPVTQPCPTFCDPMACSMPGLPVHCQLLEFTQTHVHWVSDAIQPSHPLSSPSPPAFDLSQHQGLFKWVSSSQ